VTTVLIGAGGHAKVVYEIAEQNRINFDGFIDPRMLSLKGLKKLQDNDSFESYFIGIGGVNVSQLGKRHLLYQNFKLNGSSSFKLLSPRAYVSHSAVVGNGTLVAHNAVIQADANIGENVIINTNAVVEHDAIIEDGAHIGPGAIILGGALVGAMSMIGAGAVILPGQEVRSETLVPSLTRYQND
jgi:sugar O-acyltransferase (sialic acid O-acetyltransferase NeuD family)